MSDWSSFSKDKELTDAWREFLAEDDDLDEGRFSDWMKKPNKLGRAFGAAGAAAQKVKDKYQIGSDDAPTSPLRTRGRATGASAQALRKNRQTGRAILGAWANSTKGIDPSIQGAGKELIDAAYGESAAAPPRNLTDRLKSMIANYEGDLTENVLTEEASPIEASLKKLLDASREDPKALQAVIKLTKIMIQNPPAAGEEGASDAPADPAERGAKPESKPKDEKPSLKKLSSGDLKAALSQMKNIAGITPEKLAQQIKTNSAKFMQGNPYASQIKKEQMPIIQMIVDEIIKILSGDFSNLVQESQGDFIIVHTATYNFFQKIISEGKK